MPANACSTRACSFCPSLHQTLGILAVLILSACSQDAHMPSAPDDRFPERRGEYIDKSSRGPGLGVSASATLQQTGLVTQDLTTTTAADLAQALVGTGVAVSNVTYSGADEAAGTFTGGTDIIGFESGVVLSSGNIASVIGPNVSGAIASDWQRPGDTQLETLVNNGNPSHDAAILSFDFVPDADEVFIAYVFSSDEYNEYVGSVFDDAFAFFVNGVNCAVTPVDAASAGLRVSVNTINGGGPNFGDPVAATNPELYRDNELPAATIDTEMDGLTTVLVCAAPVNNGQTNTMRLSIADMSDHILDSNVFLQAGSFSTTPPVNIPPVADAGVDQTIECSTVPCAVALDGSGSSDANEDELTYEWFDANSTLLATGATPSINLPAGLLPVVHTITLTVTDDAGATDSDVVAVMVVPVHILDVTVQGGGNPAPDAAVTVANVDTGEFFVECTDLGGEASFILEPGDYIVHARNFFICDAADLTIWPNDENFVFEPSPNQLAGFTHAIQLNGVSVALNRQNYSDAVGSPLSFGVGSTSLTLDLQAAGAIVSCTLVDANGDPFTLSADETVFGIEPFEPGDDLPPLLPGIDPDMARGIGTAVASLEFGEVSDACEMAGLTAGDFVLETNTVDANGEDVVFRESVTVTEEEASSGETIPLVLQPEPPRAFTGYLNEVLGDARGPVDLGSLVTYGWGVENDAPNDEFIVSSEFVRNGVGQPVWFTLEVRHGNTTTNVPVTCTRQPSTGTYTCTIDAPGLNATASATAHTVGGRTFGKVTITVKLPGDPSQVEFRIHSRNGNSRNMSDSAPDAGYQPAAKDGEGNSFAIMAD